MVPESDVPRFQLAVRPVRGGRERDPQRLPSHLGSFSVPSGPAGPRRHVLPPRPRPRPRASASRGGGCPRFRSAVPVPGITTPVQRKCNGADFFSCFPGLVPRHAAGREHHHPGPGRLGGWLLSRRRPTGRGDGGRKTMCARRRDARATRTGRDRLTGGLAWWAENFGAV
jgi:hypothetical protein